jgi:hypothetical protein
LSPVLDCSKQLGVPHTLTKDPTAGGVLLKTYLPTIFFAGGVTWLAKAVLQSKINATADSVAIRRLVFLIVHYDFELKILYASKVSAKCEGSDGDFSGILKVQKK